MKAIRSFFLRVYNLVKQLILWVWSIIVRIWNYNADNSFKLVFWIWGMVLLTIATVAASLAVLMFSGALYSSTPQAQIAINELKPTITRIADIANKEINRSLDRFEAKKQRWEEGKENKERW